MTNENLLKALLRGERNEDPLKFKHNKKIFKYVQHFIVKTGRLNYKSILQLTLPITE